MSMNALRSRILLFGLASFAPLAASRADVLVVDASGAGQYLQITDAVAAATDGDTLLVKSGLYAAFTVDGKSLSIVGDTGASVVIDGSIGVKNLALAQTVVLAGLTSGHSGMSSTSVDPTIGVGLFVTTSTGAVRADACQFEGKFGTNASCFGNIAPGRSGVYLGAATNVALVGCVVRGGDGGGHTGQCWCGTDGGAGGVGVNMKDSQLALYDCTSTGGKGGRGAEVGGKGGDAAAIAGTLGMLTSHSSFQGGVGGIADAGPSDPGGICLIGQGGAGGSGLRSSGPTTSAQLVGGVYVGGAGGIPFTGPAGSAGFNTVGSNIVTLDGPPRAFSAPALMREGTSYTVTYYGQPNDEVYLRMSRQTGFRDIPAWKGVLLTHNKHPEYVAIIGTIPASGVLTSTFVVPGLGAGVSALTLFLQPEFKSSEGPIWLGSFAAVTELDAAF